MMRELRAVGHEIANHTLSHADLPTLGDAALARQIGGAQDLFERHLGERPITFCYPFGHHSERVRRAVHDAGILLAFTTEWGGRLSAGELFRAPRIRVSAGLGPEALLARLEPYAGDERQTGRFVWRWRPMPVAPLPRMS